MRTAISIPLWRGLWLGLDISEEDALTKLLELNLSRAKAHLGSRIVFRIVPSLVTYAEA